MDGFMYYNICSANALEILQSCTKPSISEFNFTVFSFMVPDHALILHKQQFLDLHYGYKRWFGDATW